MNKWTVTGLIILFITIVTAPAFAKRYGFMDQANYAEKRAERIEHLKLLLDLTTEQDTAIKEIVADSRTAAEKDRELARKNREEIRALLESDTLNGTYLRELLHVQAELRADKMIRKHATRAAINQVLTPEQQEKRAALREMKRERQGFRARSQGKGESLHM